MTTDNSAVNPSNVASDGGSIVSSIDAALANPKGLSQNTQADLYQAKMDVQGLLDTVFVKNGIITQSQTDAVTATFNSAKAALLKAQAEQTNKTVLIWSCVVVAVVIGIGIYIKRKNG